MMIYSDRHEYSVLSATNSANGTAIDARANRGFYGYLYSTGNSAILTIQASHSIDADAAWLGIGQSCLPPDVHGAIHAWSHGGAGCLLQ